MDRIAHTYGQSPRRRSSSDCCTHHLFGIAYSSQCSQCSSQWTIAARYYRRHQSRGEPISQFWELQRTYQQHRQLREWSIIRSHWNSPRSWITNIQYSRACDQPRSIGHPWIHTDNRLRRGKPLFTESVRNSLRSKRIAQCWRIRHFYYGRSPSPRRSDWNQ